MTGHPSATDVAEILGAAPTRAFVAGEWVDTGRTFPVDDPATAAPIAEVADVDAALALDAVAAADAAQPSVAALPARDRGELLRRVFELLRRDRERLAVLMTMEMGKPLAESRGEVDYASEFFRWFSEEAARIDGGYRRAPSGNGRILVLRRPVGPCLLITPWNFPLAMGARKIAPAIAAGCTSIVKPAGLTPLTMLALAELVAEAGAPPGLLSVIPTTDSGATTGPLIADDRLRKLSFTGSTPVGRTLLRQAADRVLRVSMELGGNAPFIVFEDADLDAAVDGAALAKLRNGGEACRSANRFLVHEAVADPFTARLTERMAALTVGPGIDPGVDQGPLIDAGAVDRVTGWIAEAADAGADVRLGGGPIDRPGHFVQPTVVVGAPRGSRLDADEIFAPVAAVSTFADEEDAIRRANDTPYGLIAYVYTRGLDRALRVSEALETGMVGLNRGVVSDPAAPFGGVKQSGLGREGGAEGIDEYLETTYVGLP